MYSQIRHPNESMSNTYINYESINSSIEAMHVSYNSSLKHVSINNITVCDTKLIQAQSREITPICTIWQIHSIIQNSPWHKTEQTAK